MKEYKILLNGNTTGTITTDKELKVGDKVCVNYNNENGVKTNKSGKIKEILSVEELC